MELFTQVQLNELLVERQPPCVSIYLPAHRGGAREVPIQWRNALTEAQTQLVEAGWPVESVDAILKPARNLLNDVDFWKSQNDGLAAFLATDFFRVFRLSQRFAEEVRTGERFSVVPLLPMLNGDRTFFVLALSQNSPVLFRGTRDTFEEIAIDAMPANIEAALILHDRDAVLTYHTRPTSGGTFAAIFHGHGVGIDDKKDDLTRYFRAVDKALHPYLRDKKAPLVLAAVEYLHPLYESVNTYGHLLKDGIRGNADHIGRQDLHDRAWSLVEPLFESSRERAAELYQEMKDTPYVSHDVPAICAAAIEGRVETLFVAMDRPIWGKIELATGRLERHDANVMGDIDLRNLAATSALSHGRTVYGVPAAAMPGGGEMAALFFHPLPKHGPGKRP